ncbi:MAG: RuBisCO large subunit C-terminal-like domain-containing protein [Nitrospirota bacterium]
MSHRSHISFENELLRLPEAIKDEDYIFATYYIETHIDLYKAVNALAEEQSIGPSQRERERHGTKVVGIYPVPLEITTAHLPTSFTNKTPDARYNAAVIRLAFPHINFGPRLPNLLTAVAGNLYEMGSFTALKLLDLQFPSSFLRGFHGPRFGIEGTRKILNLYERPVIGAVIKPCVGISAEETAYLAYQGFKGGLDFIKDDELLADTSYNSIKERVDKVMTSTKRAEEETGENKMYAFNITDRLDKIRELHDIVVEGGGNCVMINVATVGLEAVREFSEYTSVPVHCQRDFAPLWARGEYIGINFPTISKLFRLLGGDHIHIGSIHGKLYETDEEVVSNMRPCILVFDGIKPSLPVISGGQWAGKAPINYRMMGNKDFIHLSRGGVYDHPEGGEVGAKSLRQAWEATITGIPLEEYAKDHRELARAIEHFGKVVY